MSEEVATEPHEAVLDGQASIGGGVESAESIDIRMTNSPEPEAFAGDRSETKNMDVGPVNFDDDFVEKLCEEVVENDTDLPNDPHQLQGEGGTITVITPEISNDVVESQDPMVGVNGSTVEAAESEFKFQYSDSGYHYYTSTKSGAWFAQDDTGYWFIQDADGTFKAYSPTATDETPPSAPGRFPSNGQQVDGTVAEPEPPKLINGLPLISTEPEPTAPGPMDEYDDKPIVVEPFSAADIHQTATFVAASLIDGTSSANAVDDSATVAPRSPLVPFDADGRPIYPKRADGRPILPLNREGKGLFQTDADGYPIYPIDEVSGEPVFPVNDLGEPVFGTGPDGKPMVPMDSKDNPVYPLNADGTPVFPYGSDGRPTVAFSLKTKKPMLPLDESGCPVLPHVAQPLTSAVIAARPDEPQAAPPPAVGSADGRTPLLPLPTAATSTPMSVQSAAAMYAAPPPMVGLPPAAMPVAPVGDWNQYWAQYYQQYYQTYGGYFYNGVTPAVGSAPFPMATAGMMPRPFGMPPTNVPPPNIFGGVGGNFPVGGAAPGMPPAVGFGAGLKKLKVRPEDIDLPSGPAPPPPMKNLTAANFTPLTMAAKSPFLLSSAKAVDEKAPGKEDTVAKKEATKSLISKQIKAFASMQKMKQEKDNQASSSTRGGEFDDARPSPINEDEMYGPKVPPPGVAGALPSPPTPAAATFNESQAVDVRLDKAVLPPPISDAPQRVPTPEPIRKVSSPVSRRKYRSRSTSSASSRSGSSTTASSRDGSRASRRRQRRRSSKSGDGDGGRGSRASSPASPRKRRRSDSRGSYSNKSRSRSRSHSRSPRRGYGPRYGWRGRGGGFHDDRWRGGWRGGGGGGWRGGPPSGRGFFGGGWRGARRNGVWSPRRRSPSRSPPRWRKSRSGSAVSSHSGYSRSRSPKGGAAVVAAADRSPSHDRSSLAIPTADVAPTPPPPPVGSPPASPTDRRLRDARSPVSSATSMSPPRSSRRFRDSRSPVSSASSISPPPSSRRRRTVVECDVGDDGKTMGTTPQQEQDMSISSQSPPSETALRSSRSRGAGGGDRHSVARQDSTADFKTGPTAYEPESPLVDSIFGDLTVKITNVEDQQVDWPARLILDTRTVPILHYSCNPGSYDTFKTLKRQFEEEQQKAMHAKKSEAPPTPVFQNKPITFGLSSKFETNLMLQKVTTPLIEEPAAPKWKPFGFEDAPGTSPAPVPQPQASPELIRNAIAVHRAQPLLNAVQYVPTSVDPELENLRYAALQSMEKAQKDLAYYESVVHQKKMKMLPTEAFLRPVEEMEQENFNVEESGDGVEEGELLDDIVVSEKTSKKKTRKLAKKERSHKKLSKKYKKQRKKKRARDTDEEYDYITESSDEDTDEDTGEGEPKRKRAKMSASKAKKRKRQKREKNREKKTSKHRREKKRRRHHREEKSRRRRRHRQSTTSSASDANGDDNISPNEQLL